MSNHPFGSLLTPRVISLSIQFVAFSIQLTLSLPGFLTLRLSHSFTHHSRFCIIFILICPASRAAWVSCRFIFNKSQNIGFHLKKKKTTTTTAKKYTSKHTYTCTQRRADLNPQNWITVNKLRILMHALVFAYMQPSIVHLLSQIRPF